MTAVALDVSAVVQTVPHPEAHILGNEQGLVSDSLVVDVGGDVDQTGQLLVHRIIRRPHPTVVVVGAIHLYQHAMLGRDGVEIAIAILRIVLLVAVEIGPGALHLPQLVLRGEVACLPIAAQLLIPHEGTLLTLTQGIDHLGDVTPQDIFLLLVLAADEGESKGRHIVTRAVSLQFRCGRVPALGLRIALSRESVGVAIVVELLFDGQTDELVDIKITIPSQTIVTVNTHSVKRQRLCHRLRRGHLPLSTHHLHQSRHRIAVGRGVVADDESANPIRCPYGMGGRVSPCLLRCLL